jgi:hypothetical protein
MEWYERINLIRCGFAEIGFEVPRLHESFVDAMRQRGSDEKGFTFYRYEILKEKMALSNLGINWNIENRLKIDSAARSIYLDTLYDRLTSGVYSKFGIDFRSRVLLDPNEILFYQWGVDDRRVLDKNCSGFYAAVEFEKSKEAENLKTKFEYSNLIPSALTVSSVIQLISKLAERFGFDCIVVDKTGKSRCVVRAPISDEFSIYLEWSDFKLLKSQGDLWLRFILREGKAVTWSAEDKTPDFSTDIDGIVPGAWHYLNTRGVPSLVALSIFAHMCIMQLSSNSNCMNIRR